MVTQLHEKPGGGTYYHAPSNCADALATWQPCKVCLAAVESLKLLSPCVSRLLQARSRSELLSELRLHSAAYHLVGSGKLGDLLVFGQC